MSTLPSGIYYVGDPCYVIPDEEWQGFCNAFGEADISGKFQYNGKDVVVYLTRWGDGTYTDNHGNSYPVDAGIIGVIPIELCEVQDMAKLKKYGNVVTVDLPTDTANKNYIIHFGDVAIDTDYSYDEDEEDDYWSED